RFINACSIQPDYWTEEKACLLSLLPWAITKYVAPFQAWILQSSTFFPLEVMSRGVDDGDDGDQIAFHAVHNPIRKAWRQKPADIPATLADAVNQGVGRQGVDGKTDSAGEMSTQARLLLLVPDPGRLNIDESVRVNVELIAHPPKRALSRASASDQGIDFSGCFSASSSRPSINRFSASVSSLSASQPSGP